MVLALSWSVPRFCVDKGSGLCRPFCVQVCAGASRSAHCVQVCAGTLCGLACSVAAFARGVPLACSLCCYAFGKSGLRDAVSSVSRSRLWGVRGFWHRDVSRASQRTRASPPAYRGAGTTRGLVLLASVGSVALPPWSVPGVIPQGIWLGTTLLRHCGSRRSSGLCRPLASSPTAIALGSGLCRPFALALTSQVCAGCVLGFRSVPAHRGASSRRGLLQGGSCGRCAGLCRPAPTTSPPERRARGPSDLRSIVSSRDTRGDCVKNTRTHINSILFILLLFCLQTKTK